MRRTLLTLTLALLALALVPGVATAKKAPAPTASTLTTEQLTGTSRIGGVLDCQRQFGAPWTFQFGTAGTAIGPYTGTFTEDWKMALSPTGAVTAGTVTDFEATFTINSPTGVVTGTKHFVPGTSSGTGTCGFNFLGSGIITQLAYDAKIETADGTFTDEGTTDVEFTCCNAGGAIEAFHESFVSSLLTATLVCDKFKEHPNDPAKDKCKDKP